MCFGTPGTQYHEYATIPWLPCGFDDLICYCKVTREVVTCACTTNNNCRYVFLTIVRFEHELTEPKKNRFMYKLQTVPQLMYPLIKHTLFKVVLHINQF